MKYAHSAKNGIEPQRYEDHVMGVSTRSMGYANTMACFLKKDRAFCLKVVEGAAIYHDLGKLVEENQVVLAGKKRVRQLPVNHVDAGAAHFLKEDCLCPYSAAIIQAHHRGFPNFIEESNKCEKIFRDKAIYDETNNNLKEFETIHNELVGIYSEVTNRSVYGDDTILLRQMLSCLVDGDHTDTAMHYKRYLEEPVMVPLKPEKRLEKLDAYMVKLKKEGEVNQRNELRNQMYEVCKNADIHTGISACDSPVGSGKTTAVMAHLLAQAQKRGLRRIFVVLPFTSIISQSVKKYREILVLPGEDPETVVAELHHRAEFESVDSRHLTALWRAPIIVTTAVAFFETLASNSTGTVRRLHELPGSAIFVDESHAALPTHLLPLAWRWMTIYAKECGCYWLLASGSLNRFWEIPEIAGNDKDSMVPEIVDLSLRQSLARFETNRIVYCHNLNPQSIEELAAWITSFPGPRLVILNTVQSAAALAQYFESKFGREFVEHLSTALTSEDREDTLGIVKKRLKSKQDDDWTLIATSCVEAGIDFSFRNGFRELGSLASLLQAAGRVDREGIYLSSEMWTFCIAEGDKMKLNPGLKNAGKILKGYLEENITITPDLATKAMADEIALYGNDSKSVDLLSLEKNKNFPEVEKRFKVIESNTRITVVEDSLAEQIRDGKIDWQLLQRRSVQIVKYKLDDLAVPEIVPGIYHWKYEYDSFLGYMRGVLSTITSKDEVIIL